MKAHPAAMGAPPSHLPEDWAFLAAALQLLRCDLTSLEDGLLNDSTLQPRTAQMLTSLQRIDLAQQTLAELHAYCTRQAVPWGAARGIDPATDIRLERLRAIISGSCDQEPDQSGPHPAPLPELFGTQRGASGS